MEIIMENSKNENRLEKQMKFLLEMDKLKDIGRQTYLHHGKRKENDAEHSFHLALMAAVLSEYANESVDVLRVMTMVLIHDVVEIDAGDTYAYDTKGNQSKRERELKAADRLFRLLPEDQAEYFRGLWDEFEDGTSPEAKFAHTLDHVQPTMLNDASGGKSWKEHGVCISQILNRNKNTGRGSETLWNYSRTHFVEPHVKKEGKAGEIIDDR